MKYLFTFLIAISLISCGDKQCDFPAAYEFVLPATLSPAKDTFNIGDTILVVSSFSDMVYDSKTKQKYHLVDFKFSPVSIIYKLDTNIILYDLSEFDIVVDSIYDYSILNLSDFNKEIVGQYNYNDNMYSIEYRVVLKKKGLFFHTFGADVGAFSRFQEFEGRCRNKASNAIIKLNEGEDNNVDFLLESPYHDEYGGYGRMWERRDEKFFKQGGYCFYVR